LTEGIKDIATEPLETTSSSRLARTLRFLDIGPAVGYVLLARIWQLFAGPLSVLLIARHFSPEMQGIYYTFASMLALQSFLELGLYIVIINFASHEWSKLSLDANRKIVGDPVALSRLVSLGRMVFKWYAAAAMIFIVVIGAAGYAFFERNSNGDTSWQSPWFALVVIQGLLFWALPFNSLLEGCNQVSTVNRFRFSQAVLGNFALWSAMIAGLGLWCAVISAAVNLLRDLYLLAVHYRHFFRPFFSAVGSARISWRQEIWPMQWRLAIQGICGYFMFSLFGPLLFEYQGSIVAGQFGMTMVAIAALQGISMAWLQAKVPAFGIYISKADIRSLNREWRRTTAISIGACILGGLAILAIIFLLQVSWPSIASRLLPLSPTFILLAATTVMHVVQCLVAYVRACKQEPFLYAGIAGSVATGLSAWILTAHYGVTGLAVGYLAAVTCVTFPWATLIWMRVRRTLVVQCL